MTTAAKIARAARAALRKAFPESKISVTSGHNDITVRWTDDGPTVEEVRETLLAAGCAEEKKGWDGKRYLVTPENSSGSFWFDRYNPAQRAAEQQEFERRRQAREAENQRISAVLARESAARRSTWPAVSRQGLPPVEDPAVFAAFEALRQRAETEVQISEDAARRPSWAPPLLLGEELAKLCLELGYLTLDDKWIGRLGAEFATPKRSGRWLRRHVSNLPLEGLHCRGFAMWAGGTRGPRSTLLFEAQRAQSETWRFGPQEYVHDHWSSRGREWEQLMREREGLRHELDYQLSEGRQRQVETGIAECARRLAAIDADDLVKAKAHHDRQRMRQRALELARTCVLGFIGAPDAQMRTAAALWGHCCVCGKALTDPVSLERGIGPECYALKIDSIRQLASAGREPAIIATAVGMPLEFISELLNEEATR
jgi:Family of unknown function (DUF6011)/Large polyvalent protein associated domain 29